jgi:hypothetical protein
MGGRWTSVAVRATETTRVLARREFERRRGRGLSLGSQARLTDGHLDQFFKEQRARIARVGEQGLERCRRRRLDLRQADELCTKAEAALTFDVEVRGACGSDVHWQDRD